MSKKLAVGRRQRRHSTAAAPGADPRVRRSRAAIVEAARTLFLERGYAGTTMDEIAAAAGLTKRTLYNNYGDKATLFTGIVTDVTSYAEAFARALHDQLHAPITAEGLDIVLGDVARRLVLGIVRPEVIALRRLLIGERREFPSMAVEYFDRAPGQVLAVLAIGFTRLTEAGLLQVDDARLAAEQFAYLVAGAPLDRAVLAGRTPPQRELARGAADGVRTFLARYRAVPGPTRHRRRHRTPAHPEPTA